MSRWGIVDASLEGRQAIYFPHYSAGRCPVDADLNANFRKKMRAISDPRERELIKRMCREDFLFYCHTYVYIFLAKGSPSPVPFIPYDYQVECFTVLWKCLHDGQEDCRAIKPRDMGFTWMVLTLFEHGWHFMRHLQFLLGSRKAEEIDGARQDASGATVAGEWSLLLPKIDFIHLHQPAWLLPEGYRPREEPFRTKMKIINPELGGLIAGESANPDFGRGRRYYAIGFDEHAHTDEGYSIIGSSSQTSDCHIWWSSPNGPATAHAMLGRAPIRQIRLDWWMHPLHAEGMTIDPDRGAKGRTSPWLERELARIGYDQTLSNNEIWADETQSGGGYYPQKLFDLLLGDGLQEGTVRDPVYVGELDVRPDGKTVVPIGFIEQPGGCWKLWLRFDSDGRPPRDDRYIVGVDVAAGTTDHRGLGASNSAIVVLSEMTRSKVAEYVTHGMRVPEFAEKVVAAARWFCGRENHAYLIWDAGSAGGDLTGCITQDHGMNDNIYWRITGDGQSAPGYLRSGKAAVNREPWGTHLTALWLGRYIERSIDAVGEMKHYNHDPNGGAPVHAASKNIKDPSGARANHGDRMTATVLAHMELANRQHNPRKDPDAPPYGSVLHMRALQRKADRAKVLI